MTNFFKLMADCLSRNIPNDNSGMSRYYQTEFGRAEGKRLYSEFIRNGRVR
jgi:hypothetical protein